MYVILAGIGLLMFFLSFFLKKNELGARSVMAE